MDQATRNKIVSFICYVESHNHAIRLKAEIMVDDFHEQVLAAGKIGGKWRVPKRGLVGCLNCWNSITRFMASRWRGRPRTY